MIQYHPRFAELLPVTRVLPAPQFDTNHNLAEAPICLLQQDDCVALPVSAVASLSLA